MNRQAGRSGRVWQQRIVPTVLAQARGVCALCHSAHCPTCGLAACGGRVPPGQVDHIVPVSVDPSLAEVVANCRAAHGHCNRARNSAANAKVSSRQW